MEFAILFWIGYIFPLSSSCSNAQSDASILNQISYGSFKFLSLNPVSKPVNRRFQFRFFLLPPYPTASHKTEPQVTEGRGSFHPPVPGWVSNFKQSLTLTPGYACSICKSITSNKPNSWLPVPSYRPRAQHYLLHFLDIAYLFLNTAVSSIFLYFIYHSNEWVVERVLQSIYSQCHPVQNFCLSTDLPSFKAFTDKLNSNRLSTNKDKTLFEIKEKIFYVTFSIFLNYIISVKTTGEMI